MRTRQRIVGYTNGKETRGAPYNDEFIQIIPTGVETCNDIIGNPFGDNPMEIKKRYPSGSLINGQLMVGHPFIWENYPTDYWYTYHGEYPALGIPSMSELITMLMAKTNPSRGTVNLPAFIGELKDLPRMLRHAGDVLHNLDLGLNGQLPLRGLSPSRAAASANLAYSFGWAPLVGDLLKMLDFANQVKKRSLELQRLYSKGGLKRRAKLTTGTASARENWLLMSNDISIEPEVTSKGDYDIWGTIRWLPQNLPPADLNSSAWKAISGLNAYGAIEAAWQLLPWSWLIDYFGTTSTYLQAQNNYIGATPSRANVMTHSTWTHSHEAVIKSPTLHCGGGLLQVERKGRYVDSTPNATIDVKLPFLSGKQLGILSSLLMLRAL